MKKINSKIGLYIGLLSLTTFSSCVQTSQEMGRPTLGNAKRNYNRNQKKYIIGGVYAGLLATSGVATWALWPSYTDPSGVPEGNSTNLTITTPRLPSTAFHPSIPGVSNATEWNSTPSTPTTPYDLSTASPSTPGVSTETEAGTTQPTSASPSTPGVSTTTEGSNITSTTEENQSKECYHGVVDVTYVQCLIRNNENLDNQNQDWNSFRYTNLMIAAKFNNIDAVRLLIENNANKDLRDMYNYTALIHAIRYKSIDAAKLLIHEQAHLNLRDDDKKTALDYAEEYCQNEIVALLREKGAVKGEEISSSNEEPEYPYDPSEIDSVSNSSHPMALA